MNNIYRYQLKDKEKRKVVKLLDELHYQNIGNAITNVFGESLVNTRIKERFFEFRLSRTAKNSELQHMGKLIANFDNVLDGYKKVYANSNQLFERMPNKYYGFLEGVLINENLITFVFDSVFSEELFFLKNEGRNSNFDNDSAKGHLLSDLYSFTTEISIHKQDLAVHLGKAMGSDNLNRPDTIKLYEWYVYEEKQYGALAYFYPYKEEDTDKMPDVSNEFEISNIKKVKSGSLNKELFKFFSLDSLYMDDISIATLKTLTGLSLNIRFIAIYNVGQALCTALCDEDGCPSIYFDFGMPYGSNAKTYPSNSEFCFKNKPVVILSHWDKDHWYGGVKCNDAQDCCWIVPKQTIGIQATQFAYTLWLKGKLFLWDSLEPIMSSIPLIFDWIIKCKGPQDHRHNYGISLLVNLNSDDREVKKYLLAGDNRYKYISNEVDISCIDGLVATHHGGTYSDDDILGIVNEIPQNMNNGKIVYSYGLENSHDHPSHVHDYNTKGWNSNLDTINGHCSFPDIGKRFRCSCLICNSKDYQT